MRVCLLIFLSVQAHSASLYSDPVGAFPFLPSNFSSSQEEVDQLEDLTVFR